MAWPEGKAGIMAGEEGENLEPAHFQKALPPSAQRPAAGWAQPGHGWSSGETVSLM